ncbi:MAG: hypothetical protein ACRDLY_13915 [Thermoleophilaceae bacterium]
MSTPSTKFTLRFRNPQTHEILGLVAERYGMSMNQLAEDMLERKLQAAALVLELDLTGTLDLLRGYSSGQHLERATEELAQAEGHEQDPLKARMAEPRDVHGVFQAFAT